MRQKSTTCYSFLAISALVALAAACGTVMPADEGDCERITQIVAVKNPSFDEGHVGWTEEPSNVPVLVMPDPALFTPDSGTFIARLGGTNEVEHTLTQAFDLPKQTTVVTVHARICFETDEPPNVPARDVMTIVLRDGATGVKLADLGEFSNIDAGQVCDWSSFEKEVTLASPPTKALLEFHAVADTLSITSFNIDTITVEAFGCP